MAIESGFRERDMAPRADDGIVEALRQGDETAFTMLVERYHASLIRLAMAYVHDETVAEDVAQEAWMGLMLSLPRYAGRASLKTWLFRILVNCAHASHRRESRAIAFSGLGDSGEDDGPLVPDHRFHPDGHQWAGHWSDPPEAWPEEHALESEGRAHIEAAIRQLPLQQQSVLVLRDIEGWSSTETCSVLHISESNQRVLLHRARTSVRNRLDEYFRHAEEQGP